jgi:signal transduction histidine kinase
VKLFKILTNSLLAGLFFSALLALLVADLNVNLELKPGFLVALTIRLAATYGLLICLAALFIFLIVQFFSDRLARVDWVYPSFLVLSFSLLTLTFVVLLRANYRQFLSFFDAAFRAVLHAQMIELLLLGVAGLVVYYSLRRYARRRSAFSAYLLVLLLGLALAFGQRWRYPQPKAPAGSTPLQGRKVDKRVTIIGLEGLTEDILSALISKGRLPNFAWLKENGGSARLMGFSPSERPALDASFDTGKLAAKHRRFSDSRFRLLKMKEVVEIAPRYILFKQMSRLGFLEVLPSRSTPAVTDIWQILRDNRISCARLESAADSAERGPEAAWQKLLENTFSDKGLLEDAKFGIARNAFLRDCAAEERAAEEKSRLQPQVQYFMLDGLNAVESYFYKFSFPQQFGTINQDDLNRYGPVIERYYEFYDTVIGKYLTGLKEENLLIVFSPHGIAPLPVWRRFVEMLLGDPRVSAYHETAPDGLVFFYGRGVRRGQEVPRMHIVDLAPTLLYYLGLPVARDMDGLTATSLFTEDFIRENPIIYISSYDDVRILPPP